MSDSVDGGATEKDTHLSEGSPIAKRLVDPDRHILVCSSVDHSLAKAFSESTESFTATVRQLVDEIESHFIRNEYGELVWAPVEYVNCGSIAFRGLRILYGLQVASEINAELRVFDGESLRLICRAFEHLDWKQRPTIVRAKEFVDPSRAVNRTHTELEKLELLCQLRRTKSVKRIWSAAFSRAVWLIQFRKSGRFSQGEKRFREQIDVLLASGHARLRDNNKPQGPIEFDLQYLADEGVELPAI